MYKYQINNKADLLSTADNLIAAANKISNTFSDLNHVQSMLIGGHADNASMEEVRAFYDGFNQRFEPVLELLEAFKAELYSDEEILTKGAQDAANAMTGGGAR